ncbi:MAG: hypothetical protein QM767_15555 [Anaeromyxobacter sp.]
MGPIDPLDRGSVLVEREALRAQGHPLVDADPAPDHRGLADHHPGPVVDEEALADAGARVDVDAGERVGVLGDDARDERHLEPLQRVGDPLVGDGQHARVGEDGLVAGLEGRVALVGGLDVGGHQPADLRQLGQQPLGGRLGGLEAMAAGVHVVPLGEGDAAPELLLQRPHGPGQRGADEVVQALVVEVAGAEVAREKDRAQVLHHPDHGLARRQRHLPAGGDGRGRGLAQRLHHRRERHLVHRRPLLRIVHGPTLLPALRRAVQATRTPAVEARRGDAPA